MMMLPSLTEERKHVADTANNETVYGSIQPRIWTPPLRELDPDTSYGYDVIDFARDVLNQPLDPWQEWAVIHLGELLENGRPRFREILILVARQNGKTHLLYVLVLYWLFWEQWPLIVGTSTNLQVAKEAWEKAVEAAETIPALKRFLAPGGIRRANGQEHLKTIRDSGGFAKYIIQPSNRRGGRGFTIDRLILDELREHQSWDAWNASVPATNARPNAQVIAISNQGDDNSIVLNSLRETAIKSIEQGTSHLDRTGIFEWSAPEFADISDPTVWAMANPNLGYRLPLDAIKGPALRALEMGGAEEAGFKTEMLCIPVRALEAAIDPKRWDECYLPGNLNDLASETSWGFDVNLNGTHATLVAAAPKDGFIREQVIAEWRTDQMDKVVEDLTRLLNTHKPRAFAWIPSGPAATYAGELKKTYLAPRVRVEELSGADVPAAVMGFAEAVQHLRIHHNNDPLLNDHVKSAQKRWTGDRFTITRKGSGSSDAVYAAAIAHHLAQTMPPKPNYKLIGPDDEGED